MKYLNVFCFVLLVFAVTTSYAQEKEIYLRHNIVGLKPNSTSEGILLAKSPVKGKITIKTNSGTNTVKPIRIKEGLWGDFKYQYLVPIPAAQSGTMSIQLKDTELAKVTIGEDVYRRYLDDLVAFMRQQRCGYNPYFGVACHRNDGRLFYAPVADSTYYDFSGGWHDAGDQLKYLITSSNATARMLLAYEFGKEKFADQVDAMGHPYPNEIPDILDETRWGLDWILKLHPKKDWLIHQIADDRDHRGFKAPDKDNADYGWGANSYRAAYFADGKPQGLGKWKSESTGIANIAGRCAAALALGSRTWSKLDAAYSEKLLTAAIELYEMGRKQPGFQQGNSHGAPYRYNENSWEDDMEWGAAELYKATNDERYLEESIKYAYMIKDDGVLARDSIAHYEKYPFMNMGHYSLHEVAPDTVRTQLENWYKSNLDKIVSKGKTNAFGVGTPFIWCSNNVMVNYITQTLLYEKMTGDHSYHESLKKHRDWLLGRNPWGTSMFTGIPVGGEFPEDVHLPSVPLLNKAAPGGIVDGPIYMTIYRTLKGLILTEDDEFAAFQNDYVTYHDDIGDYSTNEPTMDGTADSILMWVLMDE